SSDNPNNRSDEYDRLGPNFAKFVIDELIPEVAKKYNLTKEREGRGIFGSSSGGIAAFNVAWERPDYFHKVGSAIGSFTNIHGGDAFPAMVRAAEPKP